jgi:hypothetical protein
MARTVCDGPSSTRSGFEDKPLTCIFTLERVTGIEHALSAWESVLCGLSGGLTCGAGCPRVTVRDPSSPGLMAPR